MRLNSTIHHMACLEQRGLSLDVIIGLDPTLTLWEHLGIYTGL